tara:strand:+ start:701 stop:880 length:180 start_codon:yes stop_codon:yes gene_type:complete
MKVEIKLEELNLSKREATAFMNYLRSTQGGELGLEVNPKDLIDAYAKVKAFIIKKEREG